MRWTGIARRAGLSGFLAWHLGCLAVWNMPPCPAKARALTAVSYYMLPTGLWQYWGMFAPDPMRSTVTLEAVAVDARGMLHSFEFPKRADFPAAREPHRVRHSKYACTFAEADQVAHREFGARHAARQMGLPPEAYPITLSLLYKVAPIPPVGAGPADPMTPPVNQILQTYRFEAPEDHAP